MTKSPWLLLLLLGLGTPAIAQQSPPSCEDKLIVAESLSAQKEQMLANMVAQVRALQKQLDDLRKAHEEKKP